MDFNHPNPNPCAQILPSKYTIKRATQLQNSPNSDPYCSIFWFPHKRKGDQQVKPKIAFECVKSWLTKSSLSLSLSFSFKNKSRSNSFSCRVRCGYSGSSGQLVYGLISCAACLFYSRFSWVSLIYSLCTSARPSFSFFFNKVLYLLIQKINK